MPDEMLCPDCGGVVGATRTTAAGAPCTCFARVNASSDLDDAAEAARQSGPPKICIACGKDVNGHRRVKDSRGYTCYDCAKLEIQKERGDRVRCRSCGKLVKEATLENYEGSKICAQCMAERKQFQKTQIKRLGVKGARTRADFARIYSLAGVGGLLLLIILLHKLHIF